MNDLDNLKKEPILPLGNHDCYYEVFDQVDMNITITDPAPIVVLFGPACCGKTMALLRMARYLENDGFRVVPDVMFRRNDEHYQKLCSEFHTTVYGEYSAGGTGVNGFMMVKVVDNNGRTECQFLDATGEILINEKGLAVFPQYIESVIHSKNRRVWVFFVESHWGVDQTNRNMYVEGIRNLISIVHNINMRSDNVIFLFSKADKAEYHHLFTSKGRPNCRLFYDEVKHCYPGIFAQYERAGMARLLLGKNKFEATPFSAGEFSTDGRLHWYPSIDWYPKQFWKAIKKHL